MNSQLCNWKLPCFIAWWRVQAQSTDRISWLKLLCVSLLNDRITTTLTRKESDVLGKLSLATGELAANSIRRNLFQRNMIVFFLLYWERRSVPCGKTVYGQSKYRAPLCHTLGNKIQQFGYSVLKQNRDWAFFVFALIVLKS